MSRLSNLTRQRPGVSQLWARSVCVFGHSCVVPSPQSMPMESLPSSAEKLNCTWQYAPSGMCASVNSMSKIVSSFHSSGAEKACIMAAIMIGIPFITVC